MRLFFVTALVTLVPLGDGRAAEPESPQSLAANAALKYWQAFAHMPALDKDQEKLLEVWAKAPLDGPAGKLLDQSNDALKYLRRGAKLSQCDWSLSYEDGPGLLMPHLSRTRTLSRLALLHARREMAQGRPQGAVETAMDLLALARHTGSDLTMIGILVRYAIEANAFELLAKDLPKLDAALLEKLAGAMDAPVGGTPLPQTVLAEKKHMGDWLVRELKNADRQKPGSWRDLMNAHLDTPRAVEMIERIADLEAAVKMAEDLYPAYDELFKLTSLPPKEFDVKYREFDKRVREANGLAAYLLPTYDKVAVSERRNRVQRAMFRAALAIVEGGAEKAKATTDPFGDGPFAYRAFEGGFELMSRFIYKDEPLTLIVGEAKK